MKLPTRSDVYLCKIVQRFTSKGIAARFTLMVTSQPLQDRISSFYSKLRVYNKMNEAYIAYLS